MKQPHLHGLHWNKTLWSTQSKHLRSKPVEGFHCYAVVAMPRRKYLLYLFCICHQKMPNYFFYRSNFDAESFRTFFTNRRVSLFAKVRLKKRRTSNFPGSNYRPKIIRLRSFASKSKILLVVSISEILNLGLRLKSVLTIHLARTKLHDNLWRQWVKHYSWED